MPITAQIDGIGNLEFPDGTSPDVIHATVQKVVMQHNAPKPLTGADTPVPAGLQGGPEPEYKPFFSGDEARDELSGLGKSITPTVAAAGSLLGKVPGIGKGVIDPQKVHDLEEYSKPANKGETFGKVSGSIAQALPALLGGGEFAGGIYDELQPALGPAVSAAGGALGKVAAPVAKALGKRLLQGAGAGVSMYGLEKLRELF